MTAKRSRSGGNSDRPRPVTDGAAIDLACLNDMHPHLPGDMVLVMAMRAALGLQRHKHSSGVELQVAMESAAHRWILTWVAADLGTVNQHDSKRITEDGAEAIALAVVHKTRAWRVVRRLQQEEHADWLLEHLVNGIRKLVAFEISGTDQSSIGVRMRAKLAQVARSTDVDQRWAAVVSFEQPEVALQSVEVQTHDR